MTRPQKGKGHKRRKSWHRGHGEARRWQRTQLPPVGPGADPTTGAPRPIHLHKPTAKTRRGDAL